MSSLGDAFPDSFKEDFSRRNLKPGSVIKCFVHDTTPPKEKRFVVIAYSFDKVALGTVYINSDINPNLFQTEELRKLHLKYEAKNRLYLDHDSYIDCSRIYEKKPDELSEILKSNPGAYLGDISKEDFDEIKSTIKCAKTISAATKKKFGVFL